MKEQEKNAFALIEPISGHFMNDKKSLLALLVLRFFEQLLVYETTTDGPVMTQENLLKIFKLVIIYKLLYSVLLV
jgi:hypothetical protein